MGFLAHLEELNKRDMNRRPDIVDEEQCSDRRKRIRSIAPPSCPSSSSHPKKPCLSFSSETRTSSEIFQGGRHHQIELRDQEQISRQNEKRDQHFPASQETQTGPQSIWEAMEAMSSTDAASSAPLNPAPTNRNRPGQTDEIDNGCKTEGDVMRPLGGSKLPPGNYLLAHWDLMPSYEGPGPTFEAGFCQIGCFLAHGSELLINCRPEEGTVEVNRFSASWQFHPFRKTKKDPAHNQTSLHDCCSAKEALEVFLAFLEKVCQRERPVYDGALLLSYSRKPIPFLIKAFFKFPELRNRFFRTVKGIGDLTTFLSLEHAMKFRAGSHPLKKVPGDGRLSADLRLPHVYSVLFGKKLQMPLWKHEASKAAFEVLDKLFGGRPPNFTNFYFKYFSQPTRQSVEELHQSQTYEERMNDIFTLHALLTQKFERRGSKEGMSIILKSRKIVLKPEEADCDVSQDSLEAKLAWLTCRTLVRENLSLQTLKVMRVTKGAPFISKIVGEALMKQVEQKDQGLDIVRQMIDDVCWAVARFPVICSEKKTAEETEVTMNKARDFFRQQMSRRSSASSSAAREDVPYETKESEMGEVSAYLAKRLAKFIRKGRKNIQDTDGKVKMMIKCLIVAGLDLQGIKRTYLINEEMRRMHGFNRAVTKGILMDLLKGPFHKYGPNKDVDLNSFSAWCAECICSILFAGKNVSDLMEDCGLSSIEPYDAAEEPRPPEAPAKATITGSVRTDLEACIASLDVILKCFDSKKLAEYEARLNSLSVLRSHIHDHVSPMVGLVIPSQDEAEEASRVLVNHLHNVFAFYSFNNFRLKMLANSGGVSRLVQSLETSIDEYKECRVWPASVPSEVIAEVLAGYYKNPT